MLMALGLAGSCTCGPPPDEDSIWNPITPNRRDAGVRDAELADAGRRDGGPSSDDGGAPPDPDGGSSPDVDAGPSAVDGGSPGEDGGGAPASDAGPPDAGPPDAGAPDAGAPYGCLKGVGVCAFPLATLADGGCDYGPDYQPVETRCDGLDNDCDGVVDGFRDGGALRAAICPLTWGVCSGATAVCADGGYQACDYGPDFQIVETRCDGLDNDCDGRVDVSHPIVLLAGDAGLASRPPQLSVFDLQSAQVQLEVDGGFVISLPNRVLWLDDQLRVRRSLLVPAVHAGHSTFEGRLLPRGNTWVRVQLEYAFGPQRVCLVTFEVGGDGSLPQSPDGGLLILGSACRDGEPYFASGVRVLRDGTVIALVGLLDVNVHLEVWRVELLPDGGTTGGAVDAGVLFGYVNQVLVTPSSFVVSVLGGSLIQCDAMGQSCTTTHNREACTAIRADPPDQYCFDFDGGVAIGSFQYADGGVDSLSPDMAWSYLPDAKRIFVQSTLDGGFHPDWEPTWLSVFDHGTLTRVAQLPSSSHATCGLTLTPVGGRSALLTLYDRIPVPVYPMYYNSFSGEYVCLP